jgi:hypothetical protein
MLKINLGLSELNALRVKARADEAFLREGLGMIKGASSSSSSPTIDYIIAALANMDVQGTELRVYIKSNLTSIISLWSATRTAAQEELAQKIDALFINITGENFDSEEINIIDEETHMATAVLLACFAKYQAMFPEQPDERLRHTIKILTNKIEAYQKKTPGEPKAASITTLEKEQPDQELEEERERKADFIIEQFDPLINDFRQKVNELQSRSQSIASKTEKSRYLSAFEDGLMLLVCLGREKEALKTTADIEVFKKNVVKLLNDFPGDGKFAVNRSEPWFRACISEPFEKLKKAISKIFPEFTQRNNRFFQPSETDATKQLNTLREGAKNLTAEETKPENKNQQP